MMLRSSTLPPVSVSVAIATTPLMRECPQRVDAAIGIGAARGRHALLIGRKQAIARIAPLAALQAVSILDRLRGRGCGGSPHGQGGNGGENSERHLAAHRRISFYDGRPTTVE